MQKKEETLLSKKSLPATVPSKDSVIKVEGFTTNKKNDQQAKVASAPEGRAAEVNVTDAQVDDSAYDEVVVVAYGTNKSRAANRSKALSAGQTKRRVIPGSGWEEFERYIEDSIKINSSDSLFTGEEQLTFTIGDDGLPESIKIIQSVSPAHDKEATALQNGPSWKVIKGEKRNVTLKIIF